MKDKLRDYVLFGEIFVGLLLMEAIFRGFSIGFKNSPYLFAEIMIVLLISASMAAFLFLMRTLFPEKSAKIIYSIFVFLVSLVFASQAVYYAIFETFFTFYSMVNGGQVTEFMDTIFHYIWQAKWQIVLLFAIGGLLIWRGIKMNRQPDKKPKEKKVKERILIIAICIVTFAGGIFIGSIENDAPDSPYQSLYGVGEIKNMVRSSGCIGAMEVDFFKYITGWEPKVEAKETSVKPSANDNVIHNLDFEALAKKEDDETIRNMHSYFGSLTPTEKNEKTGIFKDKNLIFITAESFSDFAVDPVYTPTLYKLKTEGYNFTNFYNPVWGVSTLDGEYANLVGLLPKPGVWSMKEARENYLPFTLGNQFKNLGCDSKAYHDHSVYYYERDKSHPNLGYDFKGQDMGYSFKKTWPESDFEMIDKTTLDFLTPDKNGNIDQFHVYYLTVSGHMLYNFDNNEMAIKNQEAVKDLPMSDACKAYMGGQIELDKAMELLLQRLKEAGELDNTVIALVGDHYPYGLEVSDISQFKGHDVDENYEIYESSFILWTPGMEPETVDKLCSNMDVLPTLSNMFGLEYDSRLLMGKDIFSDSEGFVAFKDKNWISEAGTRESLIGKDDEYVAKQDKKVADMFNYSTLILDTDYYAHLK